MTTTEAIEYFENGKLILASINLPAQLAYDKAIEALQFMQRVEEMRPLVIEAKSIAAIHEMMQELKRNAQILHIEPGFVRCGECQACTHDPDTGKYWCRNPLGCMGCVLVKPDDHCSRGKRKECVIHGGNETV